MRRLTILLFGMAIVGCNDDVVPFSPAADAGSDAAADTTADTGTDVDPATGCETATIGATSVHGQLYTDVDASERSLWDGGAFGGPDSPLAGVTVHLMGAGETRTTASCDDGTFAFNDLANGTYFTRVEWPEGLHCRTRNCTRDAATALADGRIKIVTVGDSVPKVGDAPFFPARLAEMLAPVAEMENVNVAVPGTISEDWVPGTENFTERLAPHIDSADVVVVSVGGNDFMQYANGAFSNPQEAIAGFPDFVREVMDRVLWIKDEIEVQNPSVDFIYLLYPDYSQSDAWSEQFGMALPVIQPLVHDALEQLLDELEMEEDLVVVDLYGYFRETGFDLDDYLYDMLHFNDAGQQLYAEQLFEVLGGVTLTAEAPTAALRFAMTVE